ncbi:N-acetylneuraminate synthase [Metabacillus iocasae]|uniref:N-acetylneuraminate synthase n=1 Tax=Priestia iocasae TaxID=2291674 RepID=A0ABS2QU72_9BACI|nr:N-acetylneuraminate synthase [Metabacillus iocasae]MBM7703020.1 N-acetylneuraminate synthase [Metabacillus iocasae]
MSLSSIIHPNNPTFIIAEIGVNHNGSMTLAKELIDAAVYAGADAVKFQMFHTEELTTAQADLADYQKKTNENNQYDMLKKLELSGSEFAELKAYCDQKHILFLATPFDIQSVDFLDQLGMSMFKVGSGDLTNFPLLKRIAQTNKPMILSTGMSTTDEIDHTLSYLTSLNPTMSISILHCTSSYPAPESQLNLRVISEYIKRYPHVIGYSDHSVGIHVPIAATALGAKMIEKHLTLDRSLPGPDHAASITAQECKRMVECIRLTEQALGTRKKELTEDEKAIKPLVRRGLYMREDVAIDTVLTEKHLIALRPLASIEANQLENVIGKVVKTAKKKHEPLQWSDFYE